MTTEGRRVEDGQLPTKPGDYSLIDGVWWAIVPAPGFSVGRLSLHEVVLNEDGTITVSPSILMQHGEKSWHGYLEHGIWREV